MLIPGEAYLDQIPDRYVQDGEEKKLSGYQN
jgi:hypothetical protein